MPPRRSQKQKEPGQNSFNVETCQRWDYINMTASLNDSLGGTAKDTLSRKAFSCRWTLTRPRTTC